MEAKKTFLKRGGNQPKKICKKKGPPGPPKEKQVFVGFSLRDQLKMLEDPDYTPAGANHPSHFDQYYIPESEKDARAPRFPNQIKPSVVQEKLKQEEQKRAAEKIPKKKGGAADSLAEENELAYQYDEEQLQQINEMFCNVLKFPEAQLRKTGADIIEAPTLEIGLLLDCTSSMTSWIDKAKNSLNKIIQRAIKECEEVGNLSCRVSFIGYRDFGHKMRFEVAGFTDNVDNVMDMISRVKAYGNGDVPEDMQGGLKMCLHQDWTEEAVKRVILITDAPPHGQQFHDTTDDYPEGSPDGFKIEDLMKEFAKKDIDFQIIKLNQHVDKVAAVMKEIHQDVELVDMTKIKDEIIEAKIAAVKKLTGTVSADKLKQMLAAAQARPTLKMVDAEMERKFVESATKGIVEKVKVKQNRE